MAPVLTKNSTLAAWLFTLLLLLVSTPPLQARYVPYDEFHGLFPSAQKVKISDDTLATAFRVEECPCFAMADDKENVRYIFVLTAEKSKKNAQTMEKVRQTAENLTSYLNDRYGGAKLVSFEDGESGHVITLPSSGTSSYGTSSYGTSSYNSSTTILNTPPIVVISRLIDKGYSFYRYENGEIVLKMPNQSGDTDANFVSFILAIPKVDIVGFVPGRSLRRSDERIVETIQASLFGYSSLYTSDYSSAHAALIKNMRSSTGATKCLAVSGSFGGVAVVSYRNRYYLGTERNLKNFIRSKKRSGYAVKLSFPQQTDPMPQGGGGNAIAADKGDNKTGDKTGDADTSANAGSITELCRLFGCYPPVVQGDMAYLRLRGCKVVIAVPDKDGADLETRLGIPFRVYFICSDNGNQAMTRQYATMLAEVANLGRTGTSIYPGGVIEKTVFAGKQLSRSINSQDFLAAVTAQNFADTQMHEWPEHTIAGKPLPDDFKALLAATEKNVKAQPVQRGGATSVSPNDALKDYIQYLRRLME